MSVFEAGRTFAFFASPANKKIIKELEETGANIILFPGVTAEEIEINQASENLLKNLSGFDWIIFPDVFAADHFLRALGKLEIDFFELDALRVCAFGETVADRLRFDQVHTDVISNNAVSDEAFQALRDYEPDLNAARFLIPKEEKMNPEITSRLTSAGAVVAELPLYRARVNDSARLPKLEALLRGGAIDEFIFSSPVEAAEFAVLFPSDKISELLSGVIVSATTSTALQALREFGLSSVNLR